MDLRIELATSADSHRLFSFVDDLGDYPAWMGLVHAVSLAADDTWDVELRGRIGPFARSKKLRMTRTALDAPNHVRFERSETDGRQHGRWVLDAKVTSAAGGSNLTIDLHYSGRLWTAVVERALFDEVEASKARLSALLAG
jgi:Polyketide cyclase / dehydrase and lipid transport